MNLPKNETKPRKHILIAFTWYNPSLHRGIVRFARENNWHLNSSTAMSQHIPWGWKGDGVIFQGKNNDEYNRFIEELDCAKACMSKFRPDFWKGPIFGDDDKKIAELAADYFCERGFRNFAFYQSWPSINSRLQHFSEKLKEYDFSCFDLTPENSNLTWKERQDFLRDRLKSLPKPLAVLGIEDYAATEVLDAAIDAGLEVPEEIAVMGVRNDEMVCDTLAVPLSSIDNNLEEVGYQAAAELARQMEGARLENKYVSIPPKGVVNRKSTDVIAVDHPKVALVLDYMHSNFRLPISIDQLAEKAAMSERGLFKAFKQQLGRTPGQELVRLRINEAKRLLLETDEKVEQIAIMCGFNESRSLYTHFKEVTGKTPAAWRRNQ